MVSSRLRLKSKICIHRRLSKKRRPYASCSYVHCLVYHASIVFFVPRYPLTDPLKDSKSHLPSKIYIFLKWLKNKQPNSKPTKICSSIHDPRASSPETVPSTGICAAFVWDFKNHKDEIHQVYPDYMDGINLAEHNHDWVQNFSETNSNHESLHCLYFLSARLSKSRNSLWACWWCLPGCD